MTIDAGKGPVAVTQKFKNCRMSGFHAMKLHNFEFDFDKKTIHIVGTYPEIKKQCQYEFDGKILLLPIKGRGPSTIILKNLHIRHPFEYEEIKRKNKTYIKILSCNVTLTPELMSFNFENLFDGNKELGDNTNQVLNDNWKEVFDDVKNGYSEVFSQILIKLYDNFFSKVSLEEAFD
ncbi:unnamed protein product [Tenebrio molitor]|nr:unnamed protein product [Tenebrio molitor]